MSKPVLFLLVLVGGTVSAEVTENFHVAYYPVFLHSGATLLSQFNAASTIRENGEVFHGYTHWDIHWSYQWNIDSSDRCHLINVSTKLDVVMTLPEPRGANPLQQQAVISYSRALREHEQGHYDIARRAANDIDQSLRTMTAIADCKVLDVRANATGHELLDKYNELSRQYDKSTEYGKTQGAWLDRSL